MSTIADRKEQERPILFSGSMVRAILDGRKKQTRRIIKPQYPNAKQADVHLGTLEDPQDFHARFATYRTENVLGEVKCPYVGEYGDRLWVREKWNVARCTVDYETGSEANYYPWDPEYGQPQEYLKANPRGGYCASLHYAADGEDGNPSEFYGYCGESAEIPWRPSIHMPRWACRIVLEVVDLRVQRILDISEGDALAEGIVRGDHFLPTRKFGLPEWPLSEYRHTAREAFLHLLFDINKRVKRSENPWVWVVDFKRV